MKKILITGSIAYDHIMTFDGEFAETIIPSSLNCLSVSFLAKTHEMHFGGCAPNIAYTLNLLGEKPHICGVAGNDFERYAQRLREEGISTECISIDPNNQTASAYILTDKKQNQISIFSPGALSNLSLSINFEKAELLKDFDCVFIAPGEPHRMMYLAQDCIKNGIPYIFDPGQEAHALSREELITVIENCKGVIVNSYESKLLEQKTGQPLGDIAQKIDFLIKTSGEEGCTLYTKSMHKEIPAIPDLNVVDTTGCGDAFCAGFAYGYVNGKTLDQACEYANTAASFVLETVGGQTHKFSKEEFMKRLVLNYGEGSV